MTDKVTFGKTSWDSPAPSMGGNDDFMQLNKDGQYVVRILSESPFEYAIHWTEDVNGQKRRVKCASRDCLLCQEGIKPQLRFLIEVLNKETDEAKLIEFGPQVFNQIASLRSNRHWGDPRGYDIMIDRDKNRGPSGMYSVMPLGKEPLTEEQKAVVIAFMDRVKDVVGKMAAASTNEEILKKLGRAGAGDDAESTWGTDTPATPATSSSPPKSAEEAEESASDEWDF